MLFKEQDEKNLNRKQRNSKISENNYLKKKSGVKRWSSVCRLWSTAIPASIQAENRNYTKK